MDPILQLKNITIKFNTLTANDNVCLDIKKGETHAILGENGAGKSTLMNILYGVLKPDSGQIILDGQQVNIRQPRDARALGVGMVHQHFMLVPALTVVENIILCTCRTPLINTRKASQRIKNLSAKFGLEVNPAAVVKDLSVGQQQRVEILKALYDSCKILVLDEPTAVLTPQETKELFKIIHQLNEAGTSVVFISHKLNEIMEIADRVTVLRGGKSVWSSRKADTNEKELARHMVGRDIVFAHSENNVCRDKKIIEVRNLCVSTAYKKNVVNDLSFSVFNNEIYGIAGVDGNGQSEMVKALLSIIPKDSGQVIFCGQDITHASTNEIFRKTIGHIPEDRLNMGVISQFFIFENTSFYNYKTDEFSSTRNSINWKKEHLYSGELIKKYNVKAPSEDVALATLSGGNQQKLVVARELDKRPRFLIAAHPTRGVDIGASELIRKHLICHRDQGCAVILISTELEEIMSLSDRFGVMYEGRMIAETTPKEANIEQIGLWMAGRGA